MTLLMTDGTVRVIEGPLTLRAMQALVGGHVEFVLIGGTPDQRDTLIVDEEGLLKRKPVNQAATELYRGDPPRHDGVVVGDAIRCTCIDMGLETERYE